MTPALALNRSVFDVRCTRTAVTARSKYESCGESLKSDMRFIVGLNVKTLFSQNLQCFMSDHKRIKEQEVQTRRLSNKYIVSILAKNQGKLQPWFDGASCEVPGFLCQGLVKSVRSRGGSGLNTT